MMNITILVLNRRPGKIKLQIGIGILFFILISFMVVSAQPHSQWVVRPIDTYYKYITAVQSTEDGAIIVGYLQGNGTVGFAHKTDREGATIWTRQIALENKQLFLGSVTVSIDGSMIVSGYAYGDDLIQQPILICLNSNGSLRWAHAYKTSFSCKFSDHCLTADGGLALLGLTIADSVGNAFSSGIIVKADSLGNPLWAKRHSYLTINGPLWEKFIQARDTSFLVVSNVFIRGDKNIGLYSLAPDGSLQQRGLYHHIGESIGVSTITQASDGSFWAGGFEVIHDAIKSPMILRFKDISHIDTATAYNLPTGGIVSDLIAGPGGVMTGIIAGQNVHTDPVHICEFDSNTILQTVTTLSGRISSFAHGCRLRSDTKQFLVGSTVFSPTDDPSIDISSVSELYTACNATSLLASRTVFNVRDTSLEMEQSSLAIQKETLVPTLAEPTLVITRLCEDKVVTNDENTSPRITIVSNPVLGYSSIVVALSIIENGSYTIILRDLTGREVYRTTREATTSGEQIQIPTTGLASGVYIIELNDASNVANVWRGKVVVE